MLTHNDVIKHFEETGAILKGHFILTSGLRSDTYMQCARVLMHPSRASTLCAELAKKVREEIGVVDAVVAPAMGGIIVGYELARQLGVPSMFVERVEGIFQLRRGFSISPEQKILIVEDVITTGKSSQEAIDCVQSHGGKVVGEAAIINRAGGKNPLDIPLVTLASLEIKTYSPDNLPPELAKIPAIKPGSRKVS